MSSASVGRPTPIHLLATATLAAALALAAGLAGSLPPLTAAGIAAGGAAAVGGAALVRRGLQILVAERASGLPIAMCRCAGMLGLGVVAGGSAAAALPLTPPVHRPAVATAGLAVAAALFMAATLSAPGVARTLAAQVRYGLDGLIIGLCLALAGLLVAPELGAHHPLGYAAAVIAATFGAITLTGVLRTVRQRPLIARCGAGTALITAGLTLLVLVVGREVPYWVVLAAAALVVAGPPVSFVGARKLTAEPTPALTPAASLDEAFGGFPMLVPAVVVAVLAAGYHLVAVGTPGPVAVLLVMATGVALAGREALAGVDLRRRARRLAAQAARLGALVAGASDVTMMLDDRLVVRWQSPAAAEQFGLTDPEVRGRPFPELVHPQDAPVVTDRLRAVAAAAPGTADRGPLLAARLRDGHGRFRETESTITDLRHTPEVGALVVQVRDVGPRRDLERALRRLARTDRLTGLVDRPELVRMLAGRLRLGAPPGVLVAVELHGVAAVTERYGPAGADRVLVEAARRLAAAAGPEDLVARLGESQFAVAAAGDPVTGYGHGARLLAAAVRPYPLPDGPVHLQASVGLAPYPPAGPDDGDPAALVRRAVLAVRQAARLGRDRIEWYDEALADRLVRQRDIEHHLPGAAGRGELDLAYEPVVALDSCRPVAVAALVRWRHPVLGTVLPGDLLPTADRLEVGGEIRDWALHNACRQLATWRRDGHDLGLWLTISVAQLTAAELVPEVAAALSVHLTPPERLTVAVPEPELAADTVPAVARQLGRLRALGVRTGLAGIGADLRDPGWLWRLPLDTVTLATPTAPKCAGALASTLVDLGERLGLTVVAEQLTTAAQWERVRDAGCQYGAGRLVAPPAPAERLEAYLADRLAPETA